MVIEVADRSINTKALRTSYSGKSISPVHSNAGTCVITASRVDLCAHPVGDVQVRMKLIGRAPDNNDSVLKEELSAPARADPVNRVQFDVSLAFESEVVASEMYGVLFEVLSESTTGSGTLGWVVYPLLPCLNALNRICLFDVVPGAGSNILERLRISKKKLSKSNSYIIFKVAFESDGRNIQTQPQDHIPQLSGRFLRDSNQYVKSPDSTLDPPIRRYVTLDCPGRSFCECIQFCSEFPLLALCFGLDLLIYNTADKEYSAHRLLDRAPFALAWIGHTVVVMLSDGNIEFWDVFTGETSRIKLGHAISNFAISAGTQQFLYLGPGRLTLVRGRSMITESIADFTEGILSITSFTREFSYFLVYSDGNLSSLDIIDSKCSIRILSKHSNPIVLACETVFVDDMNTLFHFNIDGNRLQSIAILHFTPVTIQMSPDGRYTALGSIEGRFYNYKIATNECMYTSSIVFPYPIRFIEWMNGLIGIGSTPVPGSTLPVVLYASELPKLSSAFSKWADEWSSRIIPGSHVVEGIPDLKRNIVRSLIIPP